VLGINLLDEIPTVNLEQLNLINRFDLILRKKSNKKSSKKVKNIIDAKISKSFG
jgi:hypothetical protein